MGFVTTLVWLLTTDYFLFRPPMFDVGLVYVETALREHHRACLAVFAESTCSWPDGILW